MWLNQEFFEPRLNTWHQEASVLARASAGCELLRQRAGDTGHVMSCHGQHLKWCLKPEKGFHFFVYLFLLCFFFFNLTRGHRWGMNEQWQVFCLTGLIVFRWRCGKVLSKSESYHIHWWNTKLILKTPIRCSCNSFEWIRRSEGRKWECFWRDCRERIQSSLLDAEMAGNVSFQKCSSAPTELCNCAHHLFTIKIMMKIRMKQRGIQAVWTGMSV